MNPLLIRRSGMIQAQGVPLTLLYGNANVTSITNTGIKLFDPAISFTVLIDVSCNHYGWGNEQGAIGLSTNSFIFRLGRGTAINDYHYGTIYEASVNRYFALMVNNDITEKKGMSLYPRGTNVTSRKKVAFSFDVQSLEVRSVRTGFISYYWYVLSAPPSNASEVQLLVGGATGTIHDVQIYQGVIPVNQMIDYVNA